MAFGKTIAAKALNLLVATLGKILLISALHHAVDHLVLILRHGARIAEGRHCAAQAIGLIRRKRGGDHRQFHRLFLKQGHAKCAGQDIVQLLGVMRRLGGGIFDLLLSITPPQIRVDHIALNRAGADNRDLDNEVVKLFGLQARQHVDLRAAFNLKCADAVALLQHGIDRRVLGWNAVQAIIPAACLPQHFETFADAGQHTQCQDINLQQVQRVDIVLVPFNEGPVRHRAIVDRHGFIQPVFGQDIAADMLRQMAREIEQLADKGM